MSHVKPEFGPISVCTICVCLIRGGSIARPLLFLRFDLQKEVEFSVNLPSIQNGAHRRGARVVMEQIANLSTGNRCQGSNPCLSASKPDLNRSGFFMPWFTMEKLATTGA